MDFAADRPGGADPPRAARFSIGDFLCLFLAVQIPLAAIHVLVRGEERGLFWMFTLATWCIGPVVWFICGQALLRAGVSHGWRRMAYLGLVLPIVYYGLIPFVAMPAVWIWATLMEDPIVARNMRATCCGCGFVWAFCWPHAECLTAGWCSRLRLRRGDAARGCGRIREGP